MACSAGSGGREFSAADSVALLSRPRERAEVAAGGQGRLALMALRLAAPEARAGLCDPAGLSYVRVLGGELRIGSLTRLADVPGPALACGHLTVSRDVGRVIAGGGVGGRETVGGMLCQADPAVDLATVLASAQATIIISGRGGTRAVLARDFRLGSGDTVVAPGELLTEIRIPARETERS